MATNTAQQSGQQPTNPNATPSVTQTAKDFEPIVKFQALIPDLKTALADLMMQASLVINRNVAIDSATDLPDSTKDRFERSLEDFYNICDQIQIWLELARACDRQAQDCQEQYSKIVSSSNIRPGDESTLLPHQYTEYINSVRGNVENASELYSLLSDFSKQLTSR